MKKDNKNIILHQSGSGATYKINLESVTCSCLDFRYAYRFEYAVDRPERLCKHLQLYKDKLIPLKPNAKWSAKGKHAREDVQKVVDVLYRMIQNYKLKYEVCGSYRRGKDLIGDIDMIINGSIKQYNKYVDNVSDIAEKIFTRGPQKSSILFGGIQVDLRFVKKENWVYMLMHSTGTKDENVRLRRKAHTLKLKLNEYGLWNKKGKSFKVKSEKDVYALLKEIYKTPEKR